MRRRFITAVVAGVASALLAATTSPSAASPARGAAASKAPFDRAFIDAMVPHHRSAIAMAREAKRLRLSKPVLIKIANDIISSQAAEISQMLAWRKSWYGSRKIDPHGAEELGLSMAAMGMTHEASELRKAKNINKAFAVMMIAHHRGAITMSNLALQRANHTQTKGLARRIISAQRREIALMQPFASGNHHG